MPLHLDVRPPKPTPDAPIVSQGRVSRLRSAALNLSGWGPAVIAVILALCGLAVVASQQAASTADPTIRVALAPTEHRNTLIDINSATAPELETLPGIGASRAEEIIILRASRPFHSLVDLVDRGMLTQSEVRALSRYATALLPR